MCNGGTLAAIFFALAWTILPARGDDALDAQLCSAMERGDATPITTLVKQGASADATCSIATCAFAGCKAPKPTVAPALYFAVKKDDAAVVKALLDAGANVNAPEAKYGVTPLFQMRSAAVADLLFAHGADVKLRNKSKFTPLDYLVGRIGTNTTGLSEAQASDLLKILVAHGADINERNDKGGTELMSAVTMGYPVFVTALLDAGADVTLKDPQGQTALSLAVRREAMPLLASAETYRKIEEVLRAKGAKE